MNKTASQLKKQAEKAQSVLKKTKGKAAKEKARKAAMSAHAKYAAACRTGKRRSLRNEVIEIEGTSVHVIEKRQGYYFVGEFSQANEQQISKALMEKYNLSSLATLHTMEKNEDLEFQAENIDNASVA